MLKRGLSLAIVTLMVSTLAFASFGDTIKKAIGDDELADSIKVEQPTSKMIKVENLPISGTIASQGVPVTMSLIKLEGKQAIDSAATLNWPKAPANYLVGDLTSDKEKAIVKKFEKAYAERVSAGIDHENAVSALEKGKKDKLSSAKLKVLTDAAEKTADTLKEALAAYNDAAADYSKITEKAIFTDLAIGGKMPGFSKTVKDIEPGYYKLIFKREDTERIIKVQEFEVQMVDDLKTLEIPSVVKPSDNTKK